MARIQRTGHAHLQRRLNETVTICTSTLHRRQEHSKEDAHSHPMHAGPDLGQHVASLRAQSERTCTIWRWTTKCSWYIGTGSAVGIDAIPLLTNSYPLLLRRPAPGLVCVCSRLSGWSSRSFPQFVAAQFQWQSLNLKLRAESRPQQILLLLLLVLLVLANPCCAALYPRHPRRPLPFMPRAMFTLPSSVLLLSSLLLVLINLHVAASFALSMSSAPVLVSSAPFHCMLAPALPDRSSQLFLHFFRQQLHRFALSIKPSLSRLLFLPALWPASFSRQPRSLPTSCLAAEP